jgi:hypothetical protein
MNWLTLALATYGTVVSTCLGYLAWRKDRHRLRFHASYHSRHDWYGLVISVVNVGFRPITLHDVHFEQAVGSGYLNDLDSKLALSFHVEDIEPDTTAFIVRDTDRREHRMEFTPQVRAQLDAFREHTRETRPSLFAEGQERPAVVLRNLLDDSAAD